LGEYRRFQGDFVRWGLLGERATWVDLSMEEFFMGEENFHKGGAEFPSIIKKTIRN